MRANQNAPSFCILAADGLKRVNAPKKRKSNGCLLRGNERSSKVAVCLFPNEGSFKRNSKICFSTVPKLELDDKIGREKINMDKFHFLSYFQDWFMFGGTTREKRVVCTGINMSWVASASLSKDRLMWKQKRQVVRNCITKKINGGSLPKRISLLQSTWSLRTRFTTWFWTWWTKWCCTTSASGHALSRKADAVEDVFHHLLVTTHQLTAKGRYRLIQETFQ